MTTTDIASPITDPIVEVRQRYVDAAQRPRPTDESTPGRRPLRI
jgi:hypothetical protein